MSSSLRRNHPALCQTLGALACALAPLAVIATAAFVLVIAIGLKSGATGGCGGG